MENARLIHQHCSLWIYILWVVRMCATCQFSAYKFLRYIDAGDIQNINSRQRKSTPWSISNVPPKKSHLTSTEAKWLSIFLHHCLMYVSDDSFFEVGWQTTLCITKYKNCIFCQSSFKFLFPQDPNMGMWIIIQIQYKYS